jgi:hypothetical protein
MPPRPVFPQDFGQPHKLSETFYLYPVRLSVFVCIMGLLSHKVRQAPSNATAAYVRHRPETTLLYQVVQEYWPEFQAERTSQGRYLPAYVTKEFDEYLKCGRLEHGFLRIRCESCHEEKLVAFSCKKRGF